MVNPNMGAGVEDGPELAMSRLQLEAVERCELEVDVNEKARLLRHYDTQIPLLFGDDESMVNALRSRTHRGRPCEFYWHARPLFPASGGEARDD